MSPNKSDKGNVTISNRKSSRDSIKSQVEAQSLHHQESPNFSNYQSKKPETNVSKSYHSEGEGTKLILDVKSVGEEDSQRQSNITKTLSIMTNKSRPEEERFQSPMHTATDSYNTGGRSDSKETDRVSDCSKIHVAEDKKSAISDHPERSLSRPESKTAYDTSHKFESQKEISVQNESIKHSSHLSVNTKLSEPLRIEADRQIEKIGHYHSASNISQPEFSKKSVTSIVRPDSRIESNALTYNHEASEFTASKHSHALSIPDFENQILKSPDDRDKQSSEGYTSQKVSH